MFNLELRIIEFHEHVVDCRATKGKLKSFKDLKKLNWTDKKLDKFLQVK